MFKIDNEKEFMAFLKILAEESVKKSKSYLNESTDELAASFKDRLKQEKELYEQEEEADPELDAGGEEEEAEASPEPEAEKEKPQQSSSDNQEELRASLDALERNINALRAGRSLKDSTVESQLEIYFDRLGEDEKSLMVLFIRELSKILSGEVTGDSAVDPNDDPYNLDVVTSGEGEVEPEPKEDTAELQQEPEEEEIVNDEEEEEEDTSPPIQVNKPQELAEIRKRIQKLMRR